MRNINQFDLSSKSYPNDDQVKLIPAFLNKFARSRDVNYLFKFANKISKESSISEKNKKWLEWYSKYQKSCDFVKNENNNLPRISYPKLPICDSVEEIKLLIRNNQFLIIEGETGSGKTTQLPKICVEMGLTSQGLVGVTQPRRIAARSVAERIASEMDSKVGDFVGWQIRFDKKISQKTALKVMTDGLLLSEINRDRLLSDYKVLIIDEAHERSLNIDFLLGYLWKLKEKRPDLKVILSSATVDATKFSNFLRGAPVFKVSGRTFPVEIEYLNDNELDEDMEALVVKSVLKIIKCYGNKDILIFFSTEREIKEAQVALKKLKLNQCEILPLFSRLSINEQNQIFKKSNKRRIILSTNIAETSITVPNIGFVIDTGKVRLSRYSFRNKVQRLPIESISQASANQRAGRCGRIAAGTCFRLYTKADYESFSDFTDPEILRTSLASVILKMLDLRLGKIEEFSFVDRPDSRLISDGYQLLHELRAINSSKKLTRVGRSIVRFPIEPRLAVMLLEASRLKVLDEVLTIVAGLSIQNPIISQKNQESDLSFINQCRHWRSDFISVLNLWNALTRQSEANSRSKFVKFCKRNNISYVRFIEWRDLISQLKDALVSMGYSLEKYQNNEEKIHRAILSGLVTQIGFLDSQSEYKGTRNRVFSIFPGSGLSKKPPKWIMAGSLFETNKQYALNVAKIDNRWIEQYAAHLTKKQYGEPFYHKKSGTILVKETQLLFGLPIIKDKLISYEGINARLCREIFIRDALVNALYSGGGEFLQKNTELVRDLEEKENRLRSRDIFLGDKALYDFYDKRVPETVINLKSFERWRKKIEISDPKFLFVTSELIANVLPSIETEAQFPKYIDYENIRYFLEYKFEPGHSDDGLSIKIPLAVLHQTPKYLFDWLVPGMLVDKCIEMIKSLPKSTRKQFVPIPESVKSIAHLLKAENKPLGQQLGKYLFALSGEKVHEDLWDIKKINPWYRASFKLMDENNQIIEVSKDLIELKEKYRDTFKNNLASEKVQRIERDSLYSWDFDDLPEVFSFKKNTLLLKAWPALVDKGTHVAIELFDHPIEADNKGRLGQIRLAWLQSRGRFKKVLEKLFRDDDLKINAAGLNSKKELIESIVFASFYSVIFKSNGIVRYKLQFEELLEKHSSEVIQNILDMEIWLKSLFSLIHQCRIELQKLPDQFQRSKLDIYNQLNAMFKKNTLMHAQEVDLQQYPKYLKAIMIRIEKMPRKQNDDVRFMDQINHLTGCISSVTEDVNEPVFDELQRIRWLIEELRVSLFAQQLKTRQPVSYKRLIKMWDNLQEKLNTV